MAVWLIFIKVVFQPSLRRTGIASETDPNWIGTMCSG